MENYVHSLFVFVLMLQVCSLLLHRKIVINIVLHASEGNLSDPFPMRFRFRFHGKRFYDGELITDLS